MYVGGFWVELCVIHSLFESKTIWNQNLFEKDCFVKKWKNNLLFCRFNLLFITYSFFFKRV